MRRSAIVMMLCGDKGREPPVGAEHKREHKSAYAAHKMEHAGRLSKEDAEQWVAGMMSADGKRGAHWTMMQATQILHQKGYDLDEAEWYAILNAVYSDYCAVAKTFGVDNLDFYAELANAWLCDEDAVEDKAIMYYKYIVKH